MYYNSQIGTMLMQKSLFLPSYFTIFFFLALSNFQVALRPKYNVIPKSALSESGAIKDVVEFYFITHHC